MSEALEKSDLCTECLVERERGAYFQRMAEPGRYSSDGATGASGGCSSDGDRDDSGDPPADEPDDGWFKTYGGGSR
jgi:hypothetical protein